MKTSDFLMSFYVYLCVMMSTTIKPPNNGHCRSPKFHRLFEGILYWNEFIGGGFTMLWFEK